MHEYRSKYYGKECDVRRRKNMLIIGSVEILGGHEMVDFILKHQYR